MDAQNNAVQPRGKRRQEKRGIQEELTEGEPVGSLPGQKGSSEGHKRT